MAGFCIDGLFKIKIKLNKQSLPFHVWHILFLYFVCVYSLFTRRRLSSSPSLSLSPSRSVLFSLSCLTPFASHSPPQMPLGLWV